MTTTLLANEEVLCVITIIVFTLIGSFAKDYILIFTHRAKRINFGRVFFSTITASIVVYTFAPIIMNQLSIRGLIGASFLSGLSGFQILYNLSSFHGTMRFVKFLFGFGRQVEDDFSDLKKEGRVTKIIITKDPEHIIDEIEDDFKSKK